MNEQAWQCKDRRFRDWSIDDWGFKMEHGLQGHTDDKDWALPVYLSSGAWHFQKNVAPRIIAFNLIPFAHRFYSINARTCKKLLWNKWLGVKMKSIEK